MTQRLAKTRCRAVCVGGSRCSHSAKLEHAGIPMCHNHAVTYLEWLPLVGAAQARVRITKGRAAMRVASITTLLSQHGYHEVTA